MTYGSLFSGAGGFDLGFDAAGVECAFQVEIDPTCRAVLARHWPDVPRFEDVRKCGKRNLPPCDVLTFGFPCTDLSVAGQRKGLQNGTRSGLFYEAARIASELRPEFIVWENVVGLLSSDDGRDFARVLRHLADLGFHGGWRVLDAQHFGVAQRRRRVFGVFSRGRAGAERCAEILALHGGVRGHPAPGREAGEGISGTLASCLRASGVGSERIGDTRGQDTVVATAHMAKGGDPTTDNYVAHTLRAEGFDASEDGTGRGTPIVAFSSKDSGADAGELAPTLRAMGHDASHANGGGQVAIAFQERGRADGGRSQENLSYAVRRLTPTECERLQGWPDEHTRYRDDGSEIADGPRYRMIGNGVAAPVAAWIARRLLAALEGTPT